MLRKLYELKHKAIKSSKAFIQNNQSKLLSHKVIKNLNLGDMFLLGCGSAGISYHIQTSGGPPKQSIRRLPKDQQMTISDPIVKDRIKNTFIYFSGGLATISGVG
ncbi:UNKNOWN [Stylonychia lemnae]|uniref:Uncharacterized protein n=1 Tax=Stylonychia lemnae TaxID=5949 RepID=A0A078A9J4_STYLE|nr:UNKNOWN [Stylonychia lemnae]|eukprot:CDW78262.1 UNKNOWN [Stylonychia lemnae]